MPQDKIASLLPHGNLFLDNHLNVLLIGKHGTGKTFTVKQLAADRGLSLKYYSCATLDPYTDLVGVPVPDTAPDGSKRLEYVRPRDIDEAEIVFFDELNRAHPKVLNAVMEIIQFRSINGVQLPKLQCCWGAINPVEKGYEVEALDHALVDRFDYFYEIKPQVSVKFLQQYLDEKVASAFAAWWKEHHNGAFDKNYISPRRLSKMAQFYSQSHNIQLLVNQLPPDIKADMAKLKNMIGIAEGRIKQKAQNNIGASDENWKVPRKELAKNIPQLAVYLRHNPNTLDVHKHVADQLETGVSALTLMKVWQDVLIAMHPGTIDSFLNQFDYQKRHGLRVLARTGSTSVSDAMKAILTRNGVLW